MTVAGLPVVAQRLRRHRYPFSREAKPPGRWGSAGGYAPRAVLTRGAEDPGLRTLQRQADPLSVSPRQRQRKGVVGAEGQPPVRQRPVLYPGRIEHGVDYRGDKHG